MPLFLSAKPLMYRYHKGKKSPALITIHYFKLLLISLIEKIYWFCYHQGKVFFQHQTVIFYTLALTELFFIAMDYFQAHNAKQLSGWCLHFISTNFSVFESTEEFDLVQGENREHVYDHRWPPLSYLKAQEEYEQRVRKTNPNSKCKVM